MHCSLRYKSHQSRECFVMHLSSALQIGPILAAFCHALQLALQITPISTVLCHAASLCVTTPTNLVGILLCTSASLTTPDKSRERFVVHCSLLYKYQQIAKHVLRSS